MKKSIRVKNTLPPRHGCIQNEEFKMKNVSLNIIKCLAVLILSGTSVAEQNPYDDLDWQAGPKTQELVNKATIFLPEGYFYLNTEETDKYLELGQNFPTGNENFFAPDNWAWESYFSFNDIGYVKDDDEIDGDELLQQMKDGDEASNKRRKEMGWSTLTTIGWEFPPRYDTVQRRLEWAYLLKGENNEKIVNYETRILGRSGVMEVVLVATPDMLNQAVQELNSHLTTFEFKQGEKYSNYIEGDRVAEYGLAALIAGGAAALATKKGFWAAIVGFFVAMKKFAIIAVIAVFGFVISLFKRKK